MGIYDELSRLGDPSPAPKVSKAPKGQRERIVFKSPATASNHDATLPRHHDTTVSPTHEPMLEAVRRAVKEFGKEAATHRFTAEEKRAIAEIIFAYKKQGIRTSENEITRIAVNFIIHDYKENGANSLLAAFLKSLKE